MPNPGGVKLIPVVMFGNTNAQNSVVGVREDMIVEYHPSDGLRPPKEGLRRNR